MSFLKWINTIVVHIMMTAMFNVLEKQEILLNQKSYFPVPYTDKEDHRSKYCTLGYSKIEDNILFSFVNVSDIVEG